MTMRNAATLLALLLMISCTTATVPPPPPSPGPMLTFQWLRSGQPVANMRVALVRGVASRVGTTDANGRIAALDGGFTVAVVSSPTDTWGIDVPSEPGGVMRVPEPIRIRGRVESASANTRLRLRVGHGPRRPTMLRHRNERVFPYPEETENKVIAGIELPPSASLWIEVPLDANGAFTTPVLSSESDPQIVAFDDAGGLSTFDVRVPADVTSGATLDAGTIRIGPPVALDLSPDLPETDLSVTLIAAIKHATFDPAQRDAIARHLSVLDQFDDQVFEFAAARTPYALELDEATRIAGLPPFAAVELEVAGPKPGMGMSRVVTLRQDGPTAVPISAGDLRVGGSETLPAIRGRVVLAGTLTPIANATIVYSDYPVKQEAQTGANGEFTITPRGPRRQPFWFIDARRSNVPDRYKPTAGIPFEEGRTTLELPVKEETSQQGTLAGPFDACTFGMTLNDQYPACQGIYFDTDVQQWVQGTMSLCGSNDSLSLLQFDVNVWPATWEVTYSYSPFLLYTTDEVNVFDQVWIADIRPIEDIVTRIILRFCSDSSCSRFVENTPFQISSFLTDPDSFEGTADDNGNFVINCINTNPLEVYVNFIFKSPRTRFFYDNSVFIIGDTGLVKMQSSPALDQPWSLWRRDPAPFRP